MDTQTMRERLMLPSTALMLRQYRKFLNRHALREALYCQACEQSERHGGTSANVLDDKIEIVCRCTRRFFRGKSY
jgi:hypothetical protein